MNRATDHKQLQARCRTALLMLAVALILILPGFAAAQVEAPAGDDIRPPVQVAPPPDGAAHAIVNADEDLLVAMRNEPERFIGKQMTFLDGTPIGPVLDMRRKKDDLELYVVVDASRYFNEPTVYAVKAKDVQAVDDTAIKVPMEHGMHLRGLVYYEEDYTAADHFPTD